MVDLTSMQTLTRWFQDSSGPFPYVCPTLKVGMTHCIGPSFQCPHCMHIVCSVLQIKTVPPQLKSLSYAYAVTIRESVDSLCRDGTDTQYMQQESEKKTFKM